MMALPLPGVFPQLLELGEEREEPDKARAAFGQGQRRLVIVVLDPNFRHGARVERGGVLGLSTVNVDDHFQCVVLTPELEDFLGDLVACGLASSLQGLPAIRILQLLKSRSSVFQECEKNLVADRNRLVLLVLLELLNRDHARHALEVRGEEELWLPGRQDIDHALGKARLPALLDVLQERLLLRRSLG
jgi:hypothetical protein